MKILIFLTIFDIIYIGNGSGNGTNFVFVKMNLKLKEESR